eukprot:7219578-Prymnesium_polylepis.2
MDATKQDIRRVGLLEAAGYMVSSRYYDAVDVSSPTVMHTSAKRQRQRPTLIHALALARRA